GRSTAPGSVCLVCESGMAKPYPLIPPEADRVCSACDAIFTLVNRAVEAHPTTRAAGPWTRAIVVFSDGHGVDVKAKRQGQQVALAQLAIAAVHDAYSPNFGSRCRAPPVGAR